MRKYISNFAQGTSETMVKINSSILSDFIVPIPDINEQEIIVLNNYSIKKRFEKLILKMNSLQGLKRSLMQDLLTGNVRVQVN